MSKNFILITRENKGLLSFVYQAIKKDHENESKNNTKFLNYHPNIKLSFFVFAEIIKIIFSGSYFNNHKFAKIKIYNCNIGRYILSQTFKYLDTHLSFFSFNFYKLKHLLEALNIVKFSIDNNKKIKALYIDHTVYINGIFLNYFSTKNVDIYTHNYPRGLFKIKRNSQRGNLDFEDLNSIKKNKKYNYNKKKVEKFLYKKMKPNFSWPWLIETKINFEKLKKKNLQNFDALVYCHAFTDAQLQCGYSGFYKYEDWLCYTLDELQKKNKKTIIKIHPNFTKYSTHFRAKFEIKIFNRLKKKYESNSNFLFIEEPFNNYQFLRLLNKKCILISHHGTAIIEGALLGFKIISYYKGFWEKKFKITNTWNTKVKYSSLLGKNFKSLKSSNKNDFLNFANQLIFNKYGPFGKRYFLHLVSKHFKVKISDIDNGLVKLRDYNKKIKTDKLLADRLQGSIEKIF